MLRHPTDLQSQILGSSSLTCKQILLACWIVTVLTKCTSKNLRLRKIFCNKAIINQLRLLCTNWSGVGYVHKVVNIQGQTICPLMAHESLVSQDKTYNWTVIFTTSKCTFCLWGQWQLNNKLKSHGNTCPTVAIKCRHDDRCKCNLNTTAEKPWKKFSGFEQDSNPRPLRYQCNALPTELLKPHESGHVWVWPVQSLKVFSGLFSSSVLAAFASIIKLKSSNANI